MTREQALALHAELEAMVATGPGGITDTARNRLKQIDFAFQHAREGDAYLREKAFQACNYLEIWLSPRKWQQWGRDPRHFQVIVNNAVYDLRSAIEARLPVPGRPAVDQED